MLDIFDKAEIKITGARISPVLAGAGADYERVIITLEADVTVTKAEAEQIMKEANNG